MADVDEDAIPVQASTEDEELGDEAVDYRYLTTLTKTTNKLPQRGEKDFEPNPTAKQASTLDASREAMREVLSVVRVHSTRNAMVGQYLPDEKDWDGRSFDTALTRSNALKRGEGRCCVVERFTSTHGKNMGQSDRRNWTWLLPEEALYLLERGTLDIRWPDVGGIFPDETETTEIDNGDTISEPVSPLTKPVGDEILGRPSLVSLGVGELPMSLQGAYASFIGKNGLSLERYIVYANLRRIGYIVQRAPTWAEHHLEIDESSRSTSTSAHLVRTAPTMSSTSPPNFIFRILSWLLTPKRKPGCPALGPLLSPGLFRDYTDIFRELALIPYHSAKHMEQQQTSSNARATQAPFRISFDVWKPSASGTWRKSNPPPPDFRVAVVDARTSSVPTLDEIGTLLDTMPLDELPPQKKLENRLKYGKRNVILAVVDSGLVSYLRFSDACFGDLKLYEEKKNARGGGKKGGGWKRGPKKAPNNSTEVKGKK